MTPPLRVLILEDSKEDAELTVRELRRSGYDVQAHRVDSPEAMARALDETQWDLVVADYAMPQFTALDALTILRRRKQDLPFIVVSGAIGEELAAGAMRAGAHDCVMKGRLSRLGPAIRRELGEAASRRDRARAEVAWRESEERLRAIVEMAHEAIIGMDEAGRITMWNRAAESMFGWTREEAIGRIVGETIVPPQHRSAHHHGLTRFLNTEEGPILNRRIPITGLRRDGTEFPIELSCRPLRVHGCYEFSAFITDMTARQRAEAELRASEEAMRRLLEERERLSESLHDGIVQSLYGLGLMLHGIRRRLDARHEARVLLDEGIGSINGMIQEVRQYIEGSPMETITGEELGSKLERTARTLVGGDAVIMSFDLDPQAAVVLSNEEASHLYYTGREAISNCIRHANARHCWVSLAQDETTVRLEVRDDGLGFEPATVSRGKGLSNLESRALQMGATLTIDSAPQHGTRVVVGLAKGVTT